MSEPDRERTASLMTPARLALLKVRPQAGASPAAWLDQLAADAGAGHVRRLTELRATLEAQAGAGGFAGTGTAMEALRHALAKLDFTLVQPKGWLARATGKGKEAAAAFLAEHGRIEKAGEDLADEARTLLRAQQVQAAAADRSLAEYEVEVRAVEKIMDQGARWLQDMRNQLKAREAAGGDAAAQQALRDDAARCELLVTRLKQLRAASTAAQQLAERCKSGARARASLLRSVARVVDVEWKAWHEAVGAVADQVRAAGAATDGVEAARTVHAAMLASLQQAAQEFSTHASVEQALAQEFVAVQAPLRAAA